MYLISLLNCMYICTCSRLLSFDWKFDMSQHSCSHCCWSSLEVAIEANHSSPLEMCFCLVSLFLPKSFSGRKPWAIIL